MQEIITAIRAAHRERCFAMEQRKRADLSLLSFLRTQAGWRLDLPEDERKAIAERAKAFADGGDDEGLAQWRAVVDASIGARAPFDAVEKAALKRMEEAAEQLPVWETFGKPIRGFGPASLAVIVGEAGDLSIYSNPAKLWKRMGLAVMDGTRQGGLAKSTSKEDWIAHGYNRQRRSRMWNIGDALIKGNRDGEYRTLYLQRKEYELARGPEMAPIKAHRRAQRYMEKRLLRSLWAAWRQTERVEKPNAQLSAASHSDQQANEPVAPMAVLPAAATAPQTHDTHVSRGGRPNSNSEAIDVVPPKPTTPRKRRAVTGQQPMPTVPGAPIQQASGPLPPMCDVPADARGQPEGVTHPDVAPRKLSRVNGTGGQTTVATHRTGAAR